MNIWKSGDRFSTWEEFAQAYCERQEQSPDGLLAILQEQRERFSPLGWFMLECHVLDSSRLGSLTILPYGGRATFQEIPERPISPRGLASDMSLVVLVLPAENLPLAISRADKQE